MSYHATIRLEDEDDGAVHKISGRAEKVLAKALNYICQKDGGHKLIERVGRYLNEDMEALDNFLIKEFKALNKIVLKK